MVKEETVLPQHKPAVKTHSIIEKPPPSPMQPIAVTPGSTAIGTTPHSQHNSLPPQVSLIYNPLSLLYHCFEYLSSRQNTF